jgi:hypothetical protein
MQQDERQLRDGKIVRGESPLNLEMPFEKLEGLLTRTESFYVRTHFSISTTITGVILDLEAGALRELHSHPNADEWQYVIDGDDLSVTMFGSNVRSSRRINDELNPGMRRAEVGHLKAHRKSSWRGARNFSWLLRSCYAA